MSTINDNNSSISAGNDVEVVGNDSYKIAGNQINITGIAPNPNADIEELQKALDRNREDAKENLDEITELIRNGNAIRTNTRLQSRVKDAISSMANINPLIQAIKAKGGAARSISNESNVAERLNTAIKLGVSDRIIEDQRIELEKSKAEKKEEERQARRNLLIFILVGLVLVLIAVLVYFNSNTSTSSTNSSHTNVTNTSNRADSRVGKNGLLARNVKLRSSPNKTAKDIGTHYKDARVQILEVTSFDTDEGISTWFKVKVLEYGTDIDTGKGYGSEGENEGWMNAKFINIL
jgi:flagellar basal body-associated protein FliL